MDFSIKKTSQQRTPVIPVTTKDNRVHHNVIIERFYSTSSGM